MKKNLVMKLLIVVFCFTAIYTAYNAQNKSEMLSDLVLSNVEALARYELPDVEITCDGGSSGTCFISGSDCWLDYMGFFTDQDCTYTGYISHSCSTLCR